MSEKVLKYRIPNVTRQTCEVAAGSGYMSQSSSACFFGYAEGNPPRQITIGWPDGRTTRESLEDRVIGTQLKFSAAKK